MNEKSTEIIKLTNREFACLLWNTVYPERKRFKELDESTKKEWERWVSVARDIERLNGIKELKEIKQILKPQL